jgi:hypothetical protein
MHDRIAKALGWTVEQTKGFSLAALRELLPRDSKLRYEIDVSIRGGYSLLAPTTNRDGLTWSEWFRAAGYQLETLAHLGSKQFQDLRNAWSDCHDPSGYRGSAPTRIPACSCGVPKPCERHP